MGVPVDIIGPAGFDLSGKALRRAGLDYLDHVTMVRFESWEAFDRSRCSRHPAPRLVLLTTRAERSYLDLEYQETDVLLLGRESAGVPETVHAAAGARVAIPMTAGLRSLNVAVAAAMVVGEALRQTRRRGPGGP
jgi:tRNA (cytidine/uridine-2'-O-)-methyltransferase